MKKLSSTDCCLFLQKISGKIDIYIFYGGEGNE